jgi:HAMP domain-containing protein
VKERLLTLAFALAALLCFYLLFFPKPRTAVEQILPLSTEAGAAGYLAAWRWLEADEIPVASLRSRYQQLDASALSPAPTGNVLITTLPQHLPPQVAEWDSLDRWLERGNTLLIMAALDDTPQWVLGADTEVLKGLQRISRMSFSAGNDAPLLQQLFEPQSSTFVAQGQHPLLQNIHSMQAFSDLPASHWSAKSMDAVMPLAIARRAESDQSVLWLKAQGRGQIIVSAFATPFSNRELDQADNARLLSNIVGWSRSETGRVIFDDAHQGLVDFYDAAHFFADPRLHRTLLWILLLWLVFVLGPQRLRSAPEGWQSVDETALIEASGRFFSAAVDPDDARRELFANFFNQLRHRLALPEDGEPVWAWLDAQAAISAEQRLELQALYARVCAQQHVNLQRLHNFLSTLQGQLN